MKFKIAIILILISVAQLFSQHVIESVSYRIDGKTTENALARYLKVEKGQFFDSSDELIQYLDYRVQTVRNLHNTEEVSYRFLSVNEHDYLTIYSVEFYVKDGWSLVPLAYPVFSNNSIAPHIFVRDYNLFGSLSRATLSGFFDYRLLDNPDDPAHDSWGLGEWNVEFELEQAMVMGLLTDITLTQDYMEVQSINASHSFDQNYTKYMTSLDIGLGYQFYPDWRYNFGTLFVGSYGIEKYPSDGDVCDSEVLLASYVHGVTWGGLDWIGNFQEGVTVELTNSLGVAYYDASVNRDEVLFIPDITLEAIKYALLGDRANYNGRIWLYYGANRQNLEIDEMRGVNPKECFAYSSAIINNGVNFSVINNESFELQVEPFIDGGVFFAEEDFFGGEYVTKGSVGFEMTYFMHNVKGFYIWSNVGIDLTNWGEENLINFEIFGQMTF